MLKSYFRPGLPVFTLLAALLKYSTISFLLFAWVVPGLVVVGREVFGRAVPGTLLPGRFCVIEGEAPGWFLFVVCPLLPWGFAAAVPPAYSSAFCDSPGIAASAPVTVPGS